ncbi:MAG: glutaredoxin 3 [Alphaproteobacteria bacterium]|nr:glutaredoxin 3 [Alphaproteobacteria bacterium]
MAVVEIYTRPMCGFCYRAKKLLDSKGVSYSEYDIWGEGNKKEEMTKRAPGAETVPQIFIDDVLVGGCDDLMEAEASGKLDKLLGTAA